MTDFVTGIRQLLQDLVVPDLKATQTKLDALEKKADLQHDVVMKTLEAFRAEMRSEFALLKANSSMEVMRQLAPVSERVAVLEAGKQ